MLHKLKIVGGAAVLIIASSLDYDRMSMPVLLVLLGSVLVVATVALVVNFMTSPRACQLELQAAEDGFYDRPRR